MYSDSARGEFVYPVQQLTPSHSLHKIINISPSETVQKKSKFESKVRLFSCKKDLSQPVMSLWQSVRV